MFGAWTFNAAWELVISSFSIANLIGAAAVAVAILTPQLPRWLTGISDLRKWAVVVAACAFAYSGVAAHHFGRALAVKQAEWAAAVQREADNGERIRKDAENSVPAVVDDDARRLLRDDPYNRKRGK